LLVLLALISEYAGVLGPMIGASRRYDGPMGKSDRAFCFGVLGAGVASGLLPPSWIDGLLALILALLLYTLYNRVRQGLAEAAKPSSSK
jgi:CDP-diacylglycerol--glycerol-3-phosphate 3-phosphatidyltransferase